MASIPVHPSSPAPAGGPKVTLVNAFAEPFNNAMATARTCYAPRVITPYDVAKDDKARALRDRIAASTYEAGHHTTLQHATFQFVLENVSRQCIWSFLHAHPHYNSEQVSQRYVAVKPERAYVPELPPAERALYAETVAAQMQGYEALVQALTPAATEAYFSLFRARKKQPEKWARAIRKRAQEVARYVLPVATYAYLYHTVSGLTLHRYHRLAGMFDVPHETRCVVDQMVAAVHAHDPLFFAQIEDALPLEETPEYQALARHQRLRIGSSNDTALTAFDAQLEGRYAQLVDYSAQAEATLAMSVRLVLGLDAAAMDDDTAIRTVLDPALNKTLAGALNLTSLSKLGRTLSHAHYTFIKKLSHAADSQDQRHRMAPGSRPVLHAHYRGGTPDVVTPLLINHSAQAQDIFGQVNRQTWAAIDRLLSAGVPAEQALYLLPNAFPIRFVASGDLAALHHKWVSRLCYNAQEEIWAASCDEVAAVNRVHPRIARHLMPPCGVRAAAQMRPVCPEGERFCGVPVWKLRREEYSRVL